MLDARGKEIKVGQTVAYPDRRGAHLWLNISKVISVDQIQYNGYEFVPVLKVKGSTGRTSYVKALARVVVVR